MCQLTSTFRGSGDAVQLAGIVDDALSGAAAEEHRLALARRNRRAPDVSAPHSEIPG
ncbi:hypothetical protein [Mycobacterium pseudokansasii]|uniref:hypothetical protein n=1 Tax=Mycobacterium pseudokansasii TaxID=2341080 RepID=UPI001C3FDFE6|nr:hypothetical protein [Mycobacterium pseudokansasii]